MKHVMLDIETMGTGHNSVIVSIGAVFFNIETGEKGDTFYRKINFQDCLDHGLQITASTVEWWMHQNESTRDKISKEKGVTLAAALSSLGIFLQSDNKVHVWGNSARFDIGIVQNAYNKLNVPIPWDFRLELDVRTLVFLRPGIKSQHVWYGNAHDPITDCNNQIDYCCKIYKSIKHV